ncbi:MAG: helix-turn-helix transcriptional regulator [Solirubrobacterales bacterium]|nr:helix-turn-helix transcriptional regulator [Solirubrobacterales bacterium]
MSTTTTDTNTFDAFDASCPSRRLLDTIGDKWVSLVIAALGTHGRMRYTELSTKISGVSQKMLTQTLRKLERDGLLSRTVTPSVPIRTDYELTPLGHSLLETICHLKAWAEAHMRDVDTARETYDQQRNPPGAVPL